MVDKEKKTKIYVKEEGIKSGNKKNSGGERK